MQESLLVITDAGSLFQEVLANPGRSRTVVIVLQPGENTGAEVHSQFDEYARVDRGIGKVVVDGEAADIREGQVVVISSGSRHSIRNTASSGGLRLSVVYLRHPELAPRRMSTGQMASSAQVA